MPVKNGKQVLNDRQKKYCQERANGKAPSEAYRNAGYNASPGSNTRDNAYRLEHELLISPKIREEIARLKAEAEAGAILDRQARQALLTGIALDKEEKTDNRLRAADGMHMSVHGFTACEFNQIASSVGNASGYIGANGHANVFYRGALLFANRYSYTLGIYRETGTNHIWLCPENLNPDDYDALDTSAHVDTGVALPTVAANEWQTVGGNAQRVEGLAAFMPTGASQGSSSSPVGDQQYVPTPSTGNTILLFGCGANVGWNCGAFGGFWSHGAGSSAWGHAGLPRLKKTL